MLPLLIALIVFVAMGAAATALVRRHYSPGDDLAQGLEHLAGLRWRDFAKLVLQALEARGYAVQRELGGPADGLPIDGGDILLLRANQRVLLSCKYGNASIVAAHAILGLGKSAELRGAHAAIVVTPGRFDEEARRVAERQRIELIDGPTLWPEVKPFVGEQLDLAEHPPSPPAARIAGAWLAAAAVAALAWVGASAVLPDASAPATSSAGPSVGEPATPEVAADQAVPGPATPPEPTDPAALEQRRVEAARAISTLGGVDRAVWATQSTLLVYLASESVDPMEALCPLLERYPELAASRVQLQPPADSERPVRFRQCRAY